MATYTTVSQTTQCELPKRRGAWRVLLCFLLISTVSQPTLASRNASPEGLVITRHCGSVDAPANIYVDELVELALSYSLPNPQDQPHLSYRIEKHGVTCSHAREVSFLEQGKTDFFWAGTTEDIENRLIPIRIPIYKGMLGYRLLLIRGGEQARFSAINTLEELLDVSVGQGETWSDTPILKYAGFKVTTSSDPKNLAYMLGSNRFDAYPRGMMEPWVELGAWADIDLEVEQSLVIIYPMPAYIFVSPKRKELALLIESGLEKAIKDGRFDQHFVSDSRVRTGLTNSKLDDRKRIYLTNPNLPKSTPLTRRELWLHPEDFEPAN